VIGVIQAVVRAQTHALPTRVVPVVPQFASTIDAQYHECVPLGWFPDSRPWRGYFPGSNADVADTGVGGTNGHPSEIRASE
jgi:hypothetical protein